MAEKYKQKVLFVCVENACRSQMAEGLAKSLFSDFLDVYSAGSCPAETVDAKAIEAMRKIGVDISYARPKAFSDLPVQDFDYVITLGCGEVCPFVPAKKHIEWDIPDPRNKNQDFFCQVRDLIRERLEELFAAG